MGPVRILLVDDSVVVRRLFPRWLEGEAGLHVVATAASGPIALARIAQDPPDVVVLDLEMPEPDGLSTLSRIRQIAPELPVLILSNHTPRGGVQTLNALSRGASDYLQKPDRLGEGGAAPPGFCLELAAKLWSVAPAISGRSSPGVAPPAAAPAPPPVAGTPLPPLPAASSPQTPPSPLFGQLPPLQMLAIGASTGGPPAVTEFLARLPADFPTPVLLVQHMPADFTRLFAQRLNQQVPLRVAEAEPGVIPRPGEVWIAPGDWHLLLEASEEGPRLALSQAPALNGSRPAVDAMLQSSAALVGPGLLAVILTGMGVDGLAGCRAVKDHGGQVFAQNQASSVVWGMPGCVVAAGLADWEGTPAHLAKATLARAYGQAVRGLPERIGS